MNNLDIALVMAELRYLLLKMLHQVSEDDTYTKEDLQTDIKGIVKVIDDDQFPIE